jgi:hypothetical protein
MRQALNKIKKAAKNTSQSLININLPATTAGRSKSSRAQLSMPKDGRALIQSPLAQKPKKTHIVSNVGFVESLSKSTTIQ